MLKTASAPFRAGQDDRFRLDGTDHEPTTNAAKYGALTSDDGRMEIA